MPIDQALALEAQARTSHELALTRAMRGATDADQLSINDVGTSERVMLRSEIRWRRLRVIAIVETSRTLGGGFATETRLV